MKQQQLLYVQNFFSFLLQNRKQRERDTQGLMQTDRQTETEEEENNHADGSSWLLLSSSFSRSISAWPKIVKQFCLENSLYCCFSCLSVRDKSPRNELDTTHVTWYSTNRQTDRQTDRRDFWAGKGIFILEKIQNGNHLYGDIQSLFSFLKPLSPKYCRAAAATAAADPSC